MPAIDHIYKSFPHQPTGQQQELFEKIDQFLRDPNGYTCFILKGYAGTGKTTIVSALVKALKYYGLKSVLMAPTGRAAKVISSYSGRKAFTIHKRIYRKKSAMNVDEAFLPAQNVAEDTLFIVDEASMISDEGGSFSRASLLHDLIEYVYNNNNCKLLLVGDTAQLPPVGSDDSPALNAQLVQHNFGLKVSVYELTEVLRQQKMSGILYNVTGIRELIRQGLEEAPQITTKGYKDVFRMTGERLQEGLEYAYRKYGNESTLIITRSNKNANIYNQQIRTRLLYREEEITGGDQIMVVRNNYFWLQANDDDSTGFIANGDMAVIKRVRKVEEMYGLRFADVQLQFLDYTEERTMECKVLLNTISSESPALSSADQKLFYTEVMKDYAHIPNRRAQLNELKLNPYYNALQIKFSYAVTCHKAQGGQWDAVFVDQGYLTEEMINTDFLRWLYTACTRARQELFLVNFSEKFYLEQ
ncbi:ATP-dependent DNA helicase [Mucilaginibacter sp. KACC 22063]|uniref:ATP-dependent DNA helicase n=1 Tax=Mucilaginibacter sp. KACC 22063 TaxID=3025666 RepID=UPI00236591FB|nr:AAA family ATPase [Mucilaginibacter sp. KACC 22063]WDF53865.1 AAA family ATPase [Mucilaginibacter sp. KACC 22063]